MANLYLLGSSSCIAGTAGTLVTCRHDQNTVNAATGVQRCQIIQEWISLCLPGVDLNLSF